ncbi:MAG: LamG domain-containing protein [Candidatus Bathyarchaeia archaeon]
MRDVRVYYHPSVGDYASLPSFELDHGLAGAGVGGLVAGAGSYALRKADGRSLLWGLAGAVIGGAIGGALVPKRILSWFNPPPFDAPIRYPRQIPKVVVPSFIGDAEQVLNLLMHEGAGDTVKDYSSFGNNGKIYGANWVDGPFGWALSFDGVDDYVEITDSTSLRVPDPQMTVSLWVKRFSHDADYEGIITKWERVGNYKGFLIQSMLNGYVRFLIGSGPTYGVVSTLINDNEWVFLTGTYDGSVIKLFVNGVLVSSASFGGGTYTTNPIEIGRRIHGQSGYFHGHIDEPRIYKRALTDAEIKYHFESTRAIFGV